MSIGMLWKKVRSIQRLKGKQKAVYHEHEAQMRVGEAEPHHNVNGTMIMIGANM